MVSYGAMGQARPVIYELTLGSALRKCRQKLKKGYAYDIEEKCLDGKYDLKEDAGTTTLYPVDINELALLIAARSYVSIPVKEDLTGVMRSTKVTIFMDKDMAFWILCFDGDNYAIGKLKYNRNKEHLPIN